MIRRLLAVGLLSLIFSWQQGAAQQRPAPSVTTLLIAAAKSGDAASATKLLHRGADPNSHDAKGVSALEWAAAKGHVDVVTALLNAHARVDGAYNSHKYTPLFRAVAFGRRDVVVLLIAHGANVNAHTVSGNTPLDYARNAQIDAILKRHGAVRGSVASVGYGHPLALCKVSANAGFYIDKSAWTAYPNDPAQFYCLAGKHEFPGGVGQTVMYTYQVDGDAALATSLNIETQIFADAVPKAQVGQTLRQLLAAIYARVDKGPFPVDLSDAIGSLSEVRQNTALGMVTATYRPGRDGGAMDSKYVIEIQLH